MGKRKATDGDATGPSNGRGEEESSDDEDFENVDVDFEFFDPQQIDFHGLKLLSRQLFDQDAQLFDLSALVDLILSQPTLGSTIKVDGTESDPYAFLTVINLRAHQDKPSIKTLTDYIASKSSTIPSLANLPSLLSPTGPNEVGLILTERLINMPPKLVPPMYTMLLEEVEWAIQDSEPYTFTHYLILSKTYKEVASQLDHHEDAPQKSKKVKGEASDETFYFHPEDELFHKFAVGHGNFEYSTVSDEGKADSKRAFQDLGVKPQGHLVLIERGRFEEAVKAVTAFLE